MSKIKMGLPLIALLTMLFCFSCQKENIVTETSTPTIPPPPPTNEFADPVSEYVIAQNSLFEVFSIALTQALATPEFYGLTSEPGAEFRDCPDTTLYPAVANMRGDSLVFDFGAGCSFNHNGSTSSNISGSFSLEASGAITDPQSSLFLRFDGLVVNDKKIDFNFGNCDADWIKFQFIGDANNGDYTFQAKVDGTVDADCDGHVENFSDITARSHFVVTCLSTGSKTELFPFYSGSDPKFFRPAFTFNFVHPNSTPGNNIPPILAYQRLLEGCYFIDINPIVGRYYTQNPDNSYTLVDDYNIFKEDNDPIIYKPTCKYVLGGTLNYDDIPSGTGTDSNYTDGSYNPLTGLFNLGSSLNDPYKQVFYGVNSNFDQNNPSNVCDPYVKIISCESQAAGGGCNGLESVQNLDCSL